MIEVGRRDGQLKLKSITVFSDVERLESMLTEMGFKAVAEAVVVSEGKFWNKRLYKNGNESISVAQEIGEALHLRDPIVTICARKSTIDQVRTLLNE